MRKRVILVIFAVIAAMLAASTCSGKHIAGSGGLQAADSLPPASMGSLESAPPDPIAELDAMPCPEGVDAALWAELKDALEDALACRARTCGAPLTQTAEGQDGGARVPALQKTASTPPTGEANRVTDLAIADNGDGTYTLAWHYRNLGDYDQNGKVAISDITPIAMHFGETYNPETEPNSVQAVIDGSGNGKVDIADVTPIAVAFGADVASYSIRTSLLEWGAYTEIDAVSVDVAAGEGRKVFGVLLEPEIGTWYRVVPQDSTWNEGIASEAYQYIGAVPPEIISISPASGTTGSEVQFSAIVNGATPMIYAWDFGGGAEPDTSEEKQPSVVLGEPGIYDVSLTVANDYGEDTYDFQLTVYSEATYFVSGTVSKSNGGGLSGVIVYLDETSARVTNSEGYYEFSGVTVGSHVVGPVLWHWTFTPTEREVEVIDSNVEDQDFTAHSIPVAMLWASPSSGQIPLQVEFDASASFDPDGTITDYEWDLDNDGTFNETGSEADARGNSIVQVIYSSPGVYKVIVRVTDDAPLENTDTASTTIAAHGLTLQTLDSAGNVGFFTSLAIVNGSPAISYYDNTSDDLKYVRADNAVGTAWGTPLTLDSAGDVGYCTFLAVVNGNPAISYRDSTNQDLKYVRANDADGTTWGTPQTLDSAGNVGYFTSLAVVNGYPAIAYYDDSNVELKYMRATDAQGSAWEAPVTIDSMEMVGEYTSLVVVNGKPAISYYDMTNHDLKYVRASDSNGTAWDTPLAADSVDAVGEFTSLAIVNGYPAISYYDATNNDLRFVRATNENGTAWGTPLTLDDEGVYGSSYRTSLAVINGNPAVAYVDGTNYYPKYIQATDASGTAWNAPVTLETGNICRYPFLAVVNGTAAISYLNFTDGDLKFAICYY